MTDRTVMESRVTIKGVRDNKKSTTGRECVCVEMCCCACARKGCLGCFERLAKTFFLTMIHFVLVGSLWILCASAFDFECFCSRGHRFGFHTCPVAQNSTVQ